MRRLALVTAFVLALAVVGPAVPASAHTQFVVLGYAIDGTSVFQATVARTFDPYDDCPELVPGPGGPIGCLKWGVWIRELNFGAFLYEDVKFLGADNWVPQEVNAGHVGEYHGESLDPAVDFELDGYQASSNVTATGHFEQYALVPSIAPHLV